MDPSQNKLQKYDNVDNFYNELENHFSHRELKDMIDPTIEVIKNIVGPSLKKISIEDKEGKSIKLKIQLKQDRFLICNEDRLVVPTKLVFKIFF